VSRHDDQRLADILAAATAIAYPPGVVGSRMDAMRVRLIEIGEAVKAIEPGLLAREPVIPWGDVAGMRDHLAHRYFDTAHAIVQAAITQDLSPLVAAAERLLQRITTNPQG
jgi:uncharacterized protein with HEPN domain